MFAVTLELIANHSIIIYIDSLSKRRSTKCHEKVKVINMYLTRNMYSISLEIVVIL